MSKYVDKDKMVAKYITIIPNLHEVSISNSKAIDAEHKDEYIPRKQLKKLSKEKRKARIEKANMKYSLIRKALNGEIVSLKDAGLVIAEES